MIKARPPVSKLSVCAHLQTLNKRGGVALYALNSHTKILFISKSNTYQEFMNSCTYTLYTFPTGRLCSKATEVVGGSKAIRAEIKSRVVSVQASKTETHKKTSDAISRNMQEAKSKKVWVT